MGCLALPKLIISMDNPVFSKIHCPTNISAGHRKLMKKKLFSSLALGLAIGASAPAATYFQDFTFADGTTNLGDGTTIGSSEAGVAGTINSVQSNALRITQVNTNNQRASFRIPALPNSSLGWTATFDYTMTDAVGGNPPADGFTFNYGNILALTTQGAAPDGHGAAEAGMGGTVISAQVDTWRNGDANSPGVGILQNGALLAGGRTDGTVVPTDGSVSGTMSITWTPADITFTTTGLTTNASFASLAHTFAGNDAYGWAFSARTGGATQDLIIDNLRIVTIPEPSGLALLGLGLSGLIMRRRR